MKEVGSLFSNAFGLAGCWHIVLVLRIMGFWALKSIILQVAL